MSFTKYRILDLTVIIVLGVITEALGVFLTVNFIPYFNPFSIVALGIISLAITRYGWYGTISIPFLALTNTLTYTILLVTKFSSIINYQPSYYIVRGIGCLLQMLSPLILMRFYKKGTNAYLKNMGNVATASMTVALIAVVVTYISIMVDTYVIDGFNLKAEVYGYAIVYTLTYLSFGLILMMTMNLVLYKMKAFSDVYETLLDREIERQNEIDYYNVNNQSNNKEN
jgi:hypothetical protein